MPGPPELLILLVVILVLFGGAKLPKLAKSLGEAQHEFTRATDHATTQVPAPVLRAEGRTETVDHVEGH